MRERWFRIQRTGDEPDQVPRRGQGRHDPRPDGGRAVGRTPHHRAGTEGLEEWPTRRRQAETHDQNRLLTIRKTLAVLNASGIAWSDRHLQHRKRIQ